MISSCQPTVSLATNNTHVTPCSTFEIPKPPKPSIATRITFDDSVGDSTKRDFGRAIAKLQREEKKRGIVYPFNLHLKNVLGNAVDIIATKSKGQVKSKGSTHVGVMASTNVIVTAIKTAFQNSRIDLRNNFYKAFAEGSLKK